MAELTLGSMGRERDSTVSGDGSTTNRQTQEGELPCGKNLALAADQLAHMGTLIWFGQASLEPATLSFFGLRDGPGSVTIRQFSYWDFPASFGEDPAALVRLVATGRLHPEIGRVADWADTAATLTDLRKRRIRGNAVLTISSASLAPTHTEGARK